MRGYFGVICGFGLVCLLAVLAGTAGSASEPTRASFRVTLQATVSKDWNTVTDTTEDGCPATRRSTGRRTVTLKSANPTTVVVTFLSGRVSYSPSVIRFVTATVKQSGARTIRVGAPCRMQTKHSTCTRIRRVVSGGKFGFFRSGRNEISFRASRLPEITTACPGESARVRAIRSSLNQAQGAIDEAALGDPRVGPQTGRGSAEVETDLDGTEKGRVVERVNWALTFTRAR